ncbi:MAG: hypothetical protein FWD28_00400 [Treponema sp.]|nr:hypothetical protein [Treponema sp.]
MRFFAIVCLFLFIITAGLSAQTTQTTQAAQTARTAIVSSAHLNMLTQLRDSGENIGDIRFYISKPLRIVILNEGGEIPSISIANEGLAFTGEEFETLNIRNTDIGRIVNFPPAGSDIIEVVFHANNRLVVLRFRRNAEKNVFTVFSAVINTRVYNLSSQSELPQLLIQSHLNSEADEVFAVLNSGR